MATNSVPEWSSIATSKLSTKLSTATMLVGTIQEKPIFYWVYLYVTSAVFQVKQRSYGKNSVPQQEMWENQRKSVGYVAYP
jgi:hypothetical protein